MKGTNRCSEEGGEESLLLLCDPGSVLLRGRVGGRKNRRAKIIMNAMENKKHPQLFHGIGI